MSRTIDLVPPKFRRYVGTRPPHEDQRRRARSMAFSLIAECMCAPSSPHWNLTSNGLFLCAETEDYIYNGDYGTVESPYVSGTRPLLEQYVDEVVRDGMSEREKAIALLRAAHEKPLKERFGSVPIFLYGESDEQTLLKGGGHCSCRSRMLTSMYQIAGLEARPAQFWVIADPDGKIPFLGGHTVVEVRIDGHWSFVDPLPGLYVPRRDGTLASILDIRNDPTLLTNLHPSARKDLDPRAEGRDGLTFLEWTAYRFYQKHVPTLINWHDVSWPYQGTWNWATDDFRKRQAHDYALLNSFLDEMASRGELTEEVYALTGAQFRDRFNMHDKLQLPIPKDAFKHEQSRQAAASLR